MGSVYYVNATALFDISSPACAISIDGGIAIGTYAIGIQVSDYIKGSTDPLSSVPAKFLIQVLPSTSCTQK